MKKDPFGLDEPSIYPALVIGALLGFIVNIGVGVPRAIGGAIGGATLLGVIYRIVCYVRRP